MVNTATRIDTLDVMDVLSPSAELITRPAGPIMPVGDPNQMVAAIKAYEDTRRAMMTARDYFKVQGKDAPTKSYFTKLAMAYQASAEMKPGYPIYHRDDNGQLIRAECIMRVSVPNGRFTEGWGACSIDEPRFERESMRTKIEHDLPSTAETRAFNRACQKMFGYSGEVSYEEMTPDEDLERVEQRGARAGGSATSGKAATGNQLAAIAKLSRLLGLPEASPQGITGAQASERIKELSRTYNDRSIRKAPSATEGTPSNEPDSERGSQSHPGDRTGGQPGESDELDIDRLRRLQAAFTPLAQGNQNWQIVLRAAAVRLGINASDLGGINEVNAQRLIDHATAATVIDAEVVDVEEI